MGLFGKGRRSKGDERGDDPPPANIHLDDSYAQFRAVNSNAPAVDSTAGPLWSGRPAELMGDNAPDSARLAGWRIDVLQGASPGSPMVTVVAGPSGEVDFALECERRGEHDYMAVHVNDGTSSRQGPRPEPFGSAQHWVDVSVRAAVHLIQRRLAEAEGRPVNTGRVHANQNAAFIRFVDSFAGNGPALESWQVQGRIDGPAGSATWIEVWTATIGRGNDQVRYTAPMLAAGFDRSGEIVAMLALEAQPWMHDDVFLVAFHAGERVNHGSRPDLVQPEAFVAEAQRMLTPVIAAR